ncbi:MHYT domain-containing protein [Aliisedimentitalea scapharcae]|uniref:MHYT domain-containing protein n=1 Tax=Aliisedimentitalea scapharcae TaxID=1524259 RepID=A0ABZ2XR95_9RHOB
MELLDYSHNNGLVLASLFVALIAGFTGLSLTKGLSERSVPHRKILVALASLALGGGIWSMHFVAMLGLQMPILFYYDAAITLASALVAILVVGIALLILHFWKRTRATLVLSGVIVGLGVLAMHYIGMAGLELCRALYTPTGVTLAILSSCALNIAAFSIAYGQRTDRNIILGTVVFGVAVFTVHFIALWGTNFIPVETATEVGPLIGNDVMAIGVVLSSFVLCGAFLLTGITFLTPQTTAPAPTADPEPIVPEQPALTPRATQIPYEQDGHTRFVDTADVALIRAEGHYTHLYTAGEKLFCVWSITEAEKRLIPGAFIKTHRSYLVNPAFVSSFERLKDNGVCYFRIASVEKAPVSRSRLPIVREALGI